MMDLAAIERLRPCNACQGLTDGQIARVAAACVWHELKSEETLCYPGDSVVSLYIVTHGRLQVYRADERGPDQEGSPDSPTNEQFIGYGNQAETVGQSFLLSELFADDLRIVADMPSQVAEIPRSSARRR